MYTLIDQNARAFPLPGSTPFRWIEIRLCPIPVRDIPDHSAQSSQLSGGRNLPDSFIVGICPLIVHNCILQSGICSNSRFIRLIHLPRRFCINGFRLFGNHMQAMCKRFRRNRLMQIMRYCNIYSINHCFSDHFPEILIKTILRQMSKMLFGI